MLMIARVDHSVSPSALQCLSYRDRFDPSFQALHGKGFGTAVGSYCFVHSRSLHASLDEFHKIIRLRWHNVKANALAFALSAPIFCFQHFCHFLRRFLTSFCEPQFDNGIQTVSEKLNMIFNIGVDMFLFALSIIYSNNDRSFVFLYQNYYTMFAIKKQALL